MLYKCMLIAVAVMTVVYSVVHTQKGDNETTTLVHASLYGTSFYASTSYFECNVFSIVIILEVIRYQLLYKSVHMFLTKGVIRQKSSSGGSITDEMMAVVQEQM